MRIVQLTPGAGESFYCENCLRDAASLRALRAIGADAQAVPLYLPPLEDLSPEAATEPVYFGGINVYLQQKLALFRRTPRWLDRWLDARWLLRLAGRKTSMTNAAVLGETTLSMLRGEHGRQIKELDRLARHLATDPPDVILLSNALLLGLAARTAEATGAAIVCWLQDEDGFLDALPEPYRRNCWAELKARTAHADLLISPSRFFAAHMAERLELPAHAIRVVRQGVELSEAHPPRRNHNRPPKVGFLSQFCQRTGLDLLVEAVAKLRREAFANLTLRAVGGETHADKPFVAELRRRINRLGLNDAVTLETHFDPQAKAAMLAEVDVLAVPTRQPEAYGLHVLEALAAGVPVVVPSHGGQAELASDTGGGLTHAPGDVADLTRALKQVLAEPDTAAQLAAAGRHAATESFTLQRAAEQLLAACRDTAGDTA